MRISFAAIVNKAAQRHRFIVMVKRNNIFNPDSRPATKLHPFHDLKNTTSWEGAWIGVLRHPIDEDALSMRFSEQVCFEKTGIRIFMSAAFSLDWVRGF